LFSLPQMFRTCCILAACDLTRAKIDYNAADIKREGQGILLRSAQKHFNKDIKKMSDSMVSGVQTMSLRLQSNNAIELYGTRFLPILGTNDPLRMKVMRWAYELGAGSVRRTPQFGEVSWQWHPQRRNGIDLEDSKPRCQGFCQKLRDMT
jgi:hypothetical protein